MQIRQEGMFFMPTYTVYKGWLAVSYFPQPLYGFVQRANGQLPTWKPDERTLATMEKLPKEFVSVSYADPRPTVKQVLALAPMVAGFGQKFLP